MFTLGWRTKIIFKRIENWHSSQTNSRTLRKKSNYQLEKLAQNMRFCKWILYLERRAVFLLRRIPYWLVLVKRILFSMGKNKYSSDKNLKYKGFLLKGTLNLGRTSTAWERRIWTSKFSFEGTWIFRKEFNLCSKELNLRVRWEWPNRNVCPSEKYNDDWKRIQWLLTIVLGRKLPRTIYHQWNV